jgi:hypothetical protein
MQFLPLPPLTDATAAPSSPNMDNLDVWLWLSNCCTAGASHQDRPVEKPKRRETLKWYPGDAEFTWVEDSRIESLQTDSHGTASPSLSPPNNAKKPTNLYNPNAIKETASDSLISEGYDADKESGSDEKRERNIESAESDQPRGRSRTRRQTINSPKQIQDLRGSFTERPKLHTANTNGDFERPKRMNEEDREYFNKVGKWGCEHDHRLVEKIDQMHTCQVAVDAFDKGAVGNYEDGDFYRKAKNP